MTPFKDWSIEDIRGTKCEGSYQALCEHMDTVVGPDNWRVGYRWVCQEKMVCKLEVYSEKAGDYPWVYREAVDTDPHNAFREALCRWGVDAGAKPHDDDPNAALREKWLTKIKLCANHDQLQAVGVELGNDNTVPDELLPILRKAWAAMEKELT